MDDGTPAVLHVSGNGLASLKRAASETGGAALGLTGVRDGVLRIR